MANFRSLIAASAAVLCGFAAVAEDIEITVEAGQTVTRDDVISGEGKLIKKGLGTLVLTAANTYTGGTELQDGVIEIRNKNALGTGEVVINGSTEQANQIVFNCSCNDSNPIPNAFTIASSSSLAYPAMHFANKTYIGGAVQANGNFYMSTAWGNTSGQSREGNVKFMSTVTVADGFCVGGAPHCMVLFKDKLKTPLLDCCYAPNGQASNGGNAGFFELVTKGNDINKINIDQTGIYCYQSSVCTNTILEWLDNGHLEDDVGRFEMNGSQSVFDIITPVIAKGGEGCVITNVSAENATFYLYYNKVERDCYARFDGDLNFYYSKDRSGPNKNFYFKNRRHSMSGFIRSTRKYVHIGEGSSFPRLTKIENSSSCATYVESTEEDVLDGIRTIAVGSTTYEFSEAAVKSISKSRQCALTRTTGTLKLYGSTPLQVKSYYCDEKGYKFYYPAGEYTPKGSDTTYRFDYENPSTKARLTGTVLVWGDNENGTRIGWTNMVWAGASTTSSNVNDLANWEELPQYVSFKVPKAWVKFAAVDGYASLTNDVHWGGLTFTADTTNFTLKSEENDPTINLYDNGLVIEKGEGDEALQTSRSFTIKPKLSFMNEQTTFTVPANDTLTLEQPILGETLTKAGAGRLVIGGEIPAEITISGGTLEFASGATLPADDTMVLNIAEGAKIVVPQDAVLRVKTLTYAGAAVSVGYFKSGESVPYIEGAGAIRVNESTAPMSEETITWVGSGESGNFSEASNWSPSLVDWSWSNKYNVVFGSAGSAAVVDGVYAPRSIAFGVPAENGFRLKKGADNAALTVGDVVSIADDAGVKGKVFDIAVPLAFAGTTAREVVTPYGANLVLTNGIVGACNLSFTGQGTNRIHGISVNGSVTIRNRSTTLSGEIDDGVPGVTGVSAKKLWCNFSGLSTDGVDHQLRMNGITCYKYFQLTGRTTNADSLYVNAGTTNYLYGYFQRPSPQDNWFVHGDLVIAGGAAITWSSNKKSGGSVIVTDKAITTSGKSGGGARWAINGGMLALNVASNAFARTLLPQINAAKLTCGTNYVFASTVEFVDLNDNAAVFDIGCFNQRLGYVRCASTKTNAKLTGVYPARLEYSKGLEDSAGGKGVSNVNFKVEGGVSLVMDGPKDNVMLLKGAKNTIGNLEAWSGIIEFNEGASWLNGTNFTVKADGTMRFSESGNVNPGIAALHLEDGGKVNVPENVTLRFASVETNGVALSAGSYDKTNLADFITGEGSIKIASGTMFIVK